MYHVLEGTNMVAKLLIMWIYVIYPVHVTKGKLITWQKNKDYFI